MRVFLVFKIKFMMFIIRWDYFCVVGQRALTHYDWEGDNMGSLVEAKLKYYSFMLSLQLESCGTIADDRGGVSVPGRGCQRGAGGQGQNRHLPHIGDHHGGHHGKSVNFHKPETTSQGITLSPLSSTAWRPPHMAPQYICHLPCPEGEDGRHHGNSVIFNRQKTITHGITV